MPVNCAVFEFEFRGDPCAKCTGVAHDKRDNAIRLAYDMALDQGVDPHAVKRIYSEWRPSAEMAAFIKEHCPNAAVTWSFEEGDEAKFDREMKNLYGRKWWQFWKRRPEQDAAADGGRDLGS